MRRIASLRSLALGLIAAPLLAFAPGALASPGDPRAEIRPQRPSLVALPMPPRPMPPIPQAAPAVTRAVAGPVGLSCVPYARQVSGIQIRGNAREWWQAAAGRYARGQRPEAGAVLAFPPSGRMRLGHVAVVSRVINPRLIEIDHSNWRGPGIRPRQAMRGVRVQDVSENNDWTRVRVQTGWTSHAFGRVFPTHGFIYNRPPTSMMAEGGPARR